MKKRRHLSKLTQKMNQFGNLKNQHSLTLMKMRNKVMIHTKEAQLRKTMHLKKMNFQKDDNPSYFIQIMRKQLILKILKF